MVSCWAPLGSQGVLAALKRGRERETFGLIFRLYLAKEVALERTKKIKSRLMKEMDQ
jgi:hypothetical protein